MPFSTSEPAAGIHHAATLDGLADVAVSQPSSSDLATDSSSRFQLLPAPSFSALPSHGAEIRQLLQQRLGTVLILGAAIWLTIWLVGFTPIDPFFSAETIGPAGSWLALLTTVVWAGSAVVLRWRRELSLPLLRSIETTAIVVFAISNLGFRYLLFRHGLMQPLTAAGGTNLFLCAAALYNGFGWLGVIVGWGLVIPDTWRRTAVIVLGLAACPLLVDLSLIVSAPESLAAFVYPLIITAQMLSTALVLALFGSYRMLAMEQQVEAALQEAKAARMLGPYFLKRLIGAGGMGEVYLAEHHLLKRPCAIKLVRPERAGDPQTLSRFRREVEATARLKHPNTVAVFDYGRTGDGTFYYVMEHLDGLGLDEVVRRFGPLPPERVVHVLVQLCGALGEAHEAGLIHRDIKPSNILLCRQGGLFDVAKLVDFGLVRSTSVGVEESQQTRIDAIIGTPDYMSPEQADGSPLDGRSDLYSLGVMAFFLLVGRAPFTGKTALDILLAHRQQGVPEMGEQVPAALQSIVARCLGKAPAERFANAAELEQALVACEGIAPWRAAESRAWWDKAMANVDR